ncbi:DegT/DnrJ/EryC1/StrS family aminotransferase [uncultured Helicobacter sp.]|uniref:DegT/DnrJ/EryC1/StrS family aminotransferase n=1 Tax=uncultured Helicobacter sp. TaxID=175537 RepID=UPI00374EE625
MFPFIDLAKINARFDLRSAFESFVQSAQYIQGEESVRFEREFATYCGSKHCIGVSSGSSALYLILKAYKQLGKLHDHDAIIVPTNTYIASVFAITQNNLTPIFAEPSTQDFLLDTSALESLLTPRVRAIMPVHLYGQLCDMERINAFAKAHNLLVIEDSAQAHGAYLLDSHTRAGAYGDVGGFSFYPAKNLGALGDGGAITTDDDELAATLRCLANAGSTSKYTHTLDGINARLDSLQALVLRTKLALLDSDNAHRREIAKIYASAITHSEIILPHYRISSPHSHVWHLFVIRTKAREKLRSHLTRYGVQSIIHYPIPVHKQLVYARYNHLELSIAQSLQNEILSLPISQVQSIEDTHKIAEILNAFVL